MKTRGFEELQRYLADLKDDDKTLRQIAEEEFDNKVSYGTVDRCIKGIEPRDEEIRKILNLPQTIAQEFWRDVKGRRVKTPTKGDRNG